MSDEAFALPGALGEIAELVGLDAALKVAEAKGGMRAFISRRPKPDNWLTKAVGQEVADRIAEHFSSGRSGIEIEFPVGPAGSYVRQRQARAQRMQALVDEGLSSDRIAHEVGITRRNVNRFKAKNRDDGDQGNFGF